MHITGHTRVFLVLGHPVGQVRAPEVFNPLFREHGVDAVLVPADVAPAQLDGFVRGALGAANIDGLWLTIPHKAAVLEQLDRVDPLGTRAGAVNAVRRQPDGSLEGGLFDGIGLVKSLDHLGVATVGRRVLLVGTGGAGMAIAVSLAERALSTLDLFDAAPGRVAALSQRLQADSACPVRAAQSSDPAGYDIVVHATPLGLNADDPLPFDVSRLDPATTVIDILMKPHATPLQRACEARGIVCHPGFEMLAQQVPDYLQFFGYPEIAAAVQGDLDPVRRNLRALT